MAVWRRCGRQLFPCNCFLLFLSTIEKVHSSAISGITPSSNPGKAGIFTLSILTKMQAGTSVNVTATTPAQVNLHCSPYRYPASCTAGNPQQVQTGGNPHEDHVNAPEW